MGQSIRMVQAGCSQARALSLGLGGVLVRGARLRDGRAAAALPSTNVPLPSSTAAQGQDATHVQFSPGGVSHFTRGAVPISQGVTAEAVPYLVLVMGCGV